VEAKHTYPHVQDSLPLRSPTPGSGETPDIPRACVEGTFGCFKQRAVRDMEGLKASDQLGFCCPGPGPTAHRQPIAPMMSGSRSIGLMHACMLPAALLSRHR
jgi:hypothetical protein